MFRGQPEAQGTVPAGKDCARGRPRPFTAFLRIPYRLHSRRRFHRKNCPNDMPKLLLRIGHSELKTSRTNEALRQWTHQVRHRGSRAGAELNHLTTCSDHRIDQAQKCGKPPTRGGHPLYAISAWTDGEDSAYLQAYAAGLRHRFAQCRVNVPKPCHASRWLLLQGF